MDRRHFLSTLSRAGALLTVSSGTTLRAFGRPDSNLGHILTPSQEGERILVILRMFGGNDGLNTIVPIHDDEYYRVRRTSMHDLSIAAERTLSIQGLDGYGMHPGMAYFKELYDEGHAAIINGVGYPNMDMSHFRGLDIWLSASDVDVYDETGWIARMFDAAEQGEISDHPYAIEFGQAMGRLLQGRHSMHGHAYDALKIYDGDPVVDEVFGDHAKARTFNDRLRSSQRYGRAINEALARVTTHSRTYEYESPLMRGLQTTSRLIRAGFKTQVYVIHDGQFDTHHYQIPEHDYQLRILFKNIHSFFRELQDSGDAHRVCIMPISEFGRRVEPTESGTDHGTAGPVFLVGEGVAGGTYGTPPSLHDLDRNNNLLWNVDFRQIYSAILRQWFGVAPSVIDGQILSRYFAPLPLFHARSAGAQRPFTLAPIPVRDRLTIRGLMGAQTDATCRIHDLQGRLLQEFTMDLAGSATTTLQGIGAGVYVLVVTDRSGQTYKQAFPVEPL